MRMSTYIRIDTESHAGNLVLCCSQFVDDFQFWNRLNVKTKNVIIQSQIDFLVCFSYSSIYNLASRESGLDGSLDIAAAYAVSSQTAFTNDA